MAFQHATRCVAKAKGTQTQCRNPAMRYSSKCRSHGGRTPKGVASPHFKSGKFSRFLPVNLLGLFADILADEELFKLNQEAALVDLQIANQLNKLEGASGRQEEKIWQKVNRLIPVKIRLAEAETKRLILHHEYVPSQAVSRMIDALLSSLKATVTDERVLASFHYKLKQFVSEERAAELMK